MIISGSGFDSWQGTVFWPQDRLEGYGSAEVLPRGSAYLLGGGHHISHSRDVGVPPSTSLLDVSHETPTKHYYDRVIGVGGERSGPLAMTLCRQVTKLLRPPSEMCVPRTRFGAHVEAPPGRFPIFG